MPSPSKIPPLSVQNAIILPHFDGFFNFVPFRSGPSAQKTAAHFEQRVE